MGLEVRSTDSAPGAWSAVRVNPPLPALTAAWSTAPAVRVTSPEPTSAVNAPNWPAWRVTPPAPVPASMVSMVSAVTETAPEPVSTVHWDTRPAVSDRPRACVRQQGLQGTCQVCGDVPGAGVQPGPFRHLAGLEVDGAAPGAKGHSACGDVGHLDRGSPGVHLQLLQRQILG